MSDGKPQLMREFLYQLMRTIRFFFMPLFFICTVMFALKFARAMFNGGASLIVWYTQNALAYIVDIPNTHNFITPPGEAFPGFIFNFLAAIGFLVAMIVSYSISTPYATTSDMPTHRIRTCIKCGAMLDNDVYIRCPHCGKHAPSGVMLMLIRSYGLGLTLLFWGILATLFVLV